VSCGFQLVGDVLDHLVVRARQARLGPSLQTQKPRNAGPSWSEVWNEVKSCQAAVEARFVRIPKGFEIRFDALRPRRSRNKWQEDRIDDPISIEVNASTMRVACKELRIAVAPGIPPIAVLQPEPV
jgi:hypothetical protein